MKISLLFYSHKGPSVVSWETYTQRGDFFLSHTFFEERGGANACTPSLAKTPLIGCVSLARLLFSALCPNLTAWISSRDLLPVIHLLYPTVLIVLPCLLITTWQLVKAHGVTWNNPKIHGICYKTFVRYLEKNCDSLLSSFAGLYRMPFVVNSRYSYIFPSRFALLEDVLVNVQQNSCSSYSSLVSILFFGKQSTI